MIIQIAFWISATLTLLSLVLVGTAVEKKVGKDVGVHLVQFVVIGFLSYALWTVWPP